MSLRSILQRRGDEWTSSLRGLDGIEAKPKFHNENVPVFKHHGTNLVVRKELRSDEAFLKDFTPFKGKKDAYYLSRLRKEWLDSNVDDSLTLEGFFASIGGYETAAEVYEAEEDLGEPEDDEFPASVTLSFTDFEAKAEEEKAAEASMKGGGGATAASVAPTMADYLGEELRESLEDEKLELSGAIATLKQYGLESRKDIETFVDTFEGNFASTKEALLASKSSGLKYDYTLKRDAIELLRTRIITARLLSDEETVKTLKSELSSIERLATRGIPESLREVAKAWAEIKISYADVKKLFKDWKASPRGKAQLKGNPSAAAHAKLGGRTNITSIKELLTDLGLHPVIFGLGLREGESI